MGMESWSIVPGPGLLWHISRDVREWYIHHCTVPKMTLVVGFTGISAPTGPLVAKVKRYVDHSGFAREVVEEIGGLTVEGVKCLRSQDMVGLGALMTKDHRLLAILGVSCGAWTSSSRRPYHILMGQSSRGRVGAAA